MRRSTTGGTRILCALVLVAITAAGCGSDTPTKSAATTTTVGTSTTSSTEDSGPVQFSKSNDNKADVDRTGETIRIGAINDEGGALSIPEVRIGLEVAVDYINEHGGVNAGHDRP